MLSVLPHWDPLGFLGSKARRLIKGGCTLSHDSWTQTDALLTQVQSSHHWGITGKVRGDKGEV